MNTKKFLFGAVLVTGAVLFATAPAQAYFYQSQGSYNYNSPSNYGYSGYSNYSAPQPQYTYSRNDQVSGLTQAHINFVSNFLFVPSIYIPSFYSYSYYNPFSYWGW